MSARWGEADFNRASSANAGMLKKAMISDAIMLVWNIDKAPYHLGSDAARRLK